MSPMRSVAGFRTPIAARRTSAAQLEDEGEEDAEGSDDIEELNTEDMTVEERAARIRGTREELTSSVVKGHAALGLLDLCNGRR